MCQWCIFSDVNPICGNLHWTLRLTVFSPIDCLVSPGLIVIISYTITMCLSVCRRRMTWQKWEERGGRPGTMSLSSSDSSLPSSRPLTPDLAAPMSTSTRTLKSLLLVWLSFLPVHHIGLKSGIKWIIVAHIHGHQPAYPSTIQRTPSSVSTCTLKTQSE